MPKTGKVIVEGVNVATVPHQAPQARASRAASCKREIPLYACKVMLVCPKCKQAHPRRPQGRADGNKVRVCKKCGEEI